MSDEVGKAIKAALDKVAKRIRDRAVDEAPYRKGYLKKSITVHDEYDDKVIVSAGDGHAPYAVFVHEGTGKHGPLGRPYFVPVKDISYIKKDKKSKKQNVKNRQISYSRRGFWHPGIKPNPYLLRAAEKTAPEIERLVGGIVSKAVVEELQRQLKGLKDIKMEMKI